MIHTVDHKNPGLHYKISDILDKTYPLLNIVLFSKII